MNLDAYNVAWDSPSADSSGSMPLGNGDLALNVWIEPGGDLMILIAKSDACDENANLLKLGRLRMSIAPGGLAAGSMFLQELRLETAEMVITTNGVRARVWVDANQPVARVEIEGDHPVSISAALECWRTEPRRIQTQTGDLFKNLAGKNTDPHPTIVTPDLVLQPDRPGRLIWCHHNARPVHDGFEINMRLQGLGGFLDRMPHPLAGRTFGAAVAGEGMRNADARRIESASPGRRHVLSIHALTATLPVERWRDQLIRQIDETSYTPDARTAHDRWWRDFWDRGWIEVTSPDPAEREATYHITRGYVLQRFMNAAAGRTQPIKHNGSLFTVGRGDDPDFRRWGPGYWFQNQRLIYWPMLASGDFDLLFPFFRMYRDCLELQRHRTRTYFGHAGAHYPETIYFWGAEVSGHYGWTPFERRARPEAECRYLTYYWSGGIELSLMMIEYVEHTLDESFARDFLVPVADAVIEFFDLHYPRGADGRIRFEPAQALETWHEAVNPTPEIAGLSYLLARLRECPGIDLPPALRERCTRMPAELPPIPVGENAGRRVILPAGRFDLKKNVENPELYAVFPYRLFGVGKPDLQIARDTYAARLHVQHTCWHQDAIHAALLGLADDARASLIERASPASHSDSRFPGFWNAFHDWIPDVDHGGVLQRALQAMLMQCEGETIRLIPAWPAGWEASFRLHAPGNTVLQGRVAGGRLVSLDVTPRSRRGDVIVGDTPLPVDEPGTRDPAR